MSVCGEHVLLTVRNQLIRIVHGKQSNNRIEERANTPVAISIPSPATTFVASTYTRTLLQVAFFGLGLSSVKNNPPVFRLQMPVLLLRDCSCCSLPGRWVRLQGMNCVGSGGTGWLVGQGATGQG